MEIRGGENINKKTLIFLTIFIFIISISSVSAVDANNTNGSSISSADDNTVLNDPDVNLSFTDLNNAISDGEENSTIKLNNDYKYDNSTDNSFIDGIIVNKSITIDGQGHTIDGSGIARGFNISSNNVCLINCKFINCNATNASGGAILWLGDYGLIINSSFSNNTASKEGGAIKCLGNHISIVNSTFKANSAESGGVISFNGSSYNSITNSNFYENYVENFGSVYLSNSTSNSISNCTFANNSGGLGTAICNRAENTNITACKFENSYGRVSAADIYWAAYYGVISNSSFKNSRGGGWPASIFYSGINGTIINCDFDNCTSSLGPVLCIYGGHELKCINITATNCNGNNGGVIFDFYGVNNSIINSSFVNNTALASGGVIYSISDNFTVINSSFINNKANSNGGAILNSGNNFRIIDSKFVNNTDSRNSSLINQGSLELNNNTLSDGDYIYNFDTITSPVYVIINNITCFGGDSVNLSSTIYDDNNNRIVEGDYSYIVNGTIINATNINLTENYTAPITPGNYSIGGNYSGATDVHYVNGTLTVANLRITSNNISYGEDLKVIFNVDGNFSGEVNYEIDNHTYHCNVVNGTGVGNVSSLKPGEYVLNASYINGTHTLYQNITVNVSKANSTLNISVNNITYGENENIIIKVLPNTSGNITIRFLSLVDTNELENGSHTLNIAGLNPGNYSINVSFNGNDYYNPSNITATFTVSKLNPDMNVSFVNNTVIVNLPVNATGNITVIIGNDKFTSNITNGTVKIPISKDLKNGEYTINVIYSGNSIYNQTNVTINITVNNTLVNTMNTTNDTNNDLLINNITDKLINNITDKNKKISNKVDIKTSQNTGYPIIVLILGLITIVCSTLRKN